MATNDGNPNDTPADLQPKKDPKANDPHATAAGASLEQYWDELDSHVSKIAETLGIMPTSPDTSSPASDDPNKTVSPAANDDYWDDDGASKATSPSTPTSAAKPRDPNATFDPSTHADPWADEESSTPSQKSSSSRDATRTPRDLADSTNCPESMKTIGGGDLEAFWGDSINDKQPGMTLKGPRETRSDMQETLAKPAVPAPTNGVASMQGYELLNVLGEGGVGIVYRGVQKSINRNIAIKMVKPDIAHSADQRNKFVSEAIVMGDLDHPNIVPIHDLGSTDDGRPFYVMKMVKGTPWKDIVENNTLERNLQILLAVCDAIYFAHCKGIIHRDLKTDNVMLGEFGEIQVMDWGLAAAVEPTGKAPLITEMQMAGGTPSYMAPEMATGELGPVGIHSDIYLLGGILYEIITGKPPHGGKRVLDVLQNALNNVIEPTDRQGILLEIAMKAMATRPRDRYPSVQAFKHAIEAYQTNAQSIRLAERATDDVNTATVSGDYNLFSQAIFGFREALELWSANEQARSGLVRAQFFYAKCAFEKGDLDLAQSVLDASCPDHVDLLKQVSDERERRLAAKRRLTLLKRVALGLIVFVMIIMTVASIWISAERKKAVREREIADNQRQIADQQRELADVARDRAQIEERRAVQALEDLKKAVAEKERAKALEEKAKAEAQAAEKTATLTRDQLAKSGMLLDNSWWTYNADQARKRQQQAATQLKMPTTLDITLNDKTTLSMAIIPPGEFVMGSSPKEEKRTAQESLHRVKLTRPFYLARYELTETQWQAIVGAPPAGVADRPADPKLPASMVAAEKVRSELLAKIQRFAPKGWRFDLPTEAEWEYAARAGTATAFASGDNEASLARAGWYVANSGRKVQPVGTLQPNAFGLYDMHGNVSEICRDDYVTNYYMDSSTEDPAAYVDGLKPVLRGGGILNLPEHCRSAYRSYIYRRNQYQFVGVRLALIPADTPVLTSRATTTQAAPPAAKAKK